MSALALIDEWPVAHAGAAAVTADGVATHGDTTRRFRLASLSKVITAWAILVGVEDGTIDLDGPLGHVEAPTGATMRHLLSHAAGYPFDGEQPVAPIETRRIYSNTGIELGATELALAAGIPFETYLAEAVLHPLGMSATQLTGSPAHGMTSTVDDMARFIGEMRRPRLLAASTVNEATRSQFAALAGIVPGVGRFNPCPWGLGAELRGEKTPHWTGRTNSAATFGHFGGAGTMMWCDPVADVALVALTDRPFDEWAIDAMRAWPELSDAVLADAAGAR